MNEHNKKRVERVKTKDFATNCKNCETKHFGLCELQKQPQMKTKHKKEEKGIEIHRLAIYNNGEEVLYLNSQQLIEKMGGMIASKGLLDDDTYLGSTVKKEIGYGYNRAIDQVINLLNNQTR